jgi:ornithine cyclodeaminase/alanine dehydrogenase-like protein (mu-crystallin family)
MPLVLTREEVGPLLDLPKAIELTENAFAQQAKGEVVPHAPYHISMGGSKALRVVSGALLASQRAAVRLGPNSELGGDRMHAVLFDTESGDLLSIMAYPFGTLRTAAHVAVAAKHMAREDAQRVGLFGVGRNALGLLKAIASIRKIKEVSVSSRDAQRRKNFCAEASQLLSLEVRPVDSPESAVRGMDVVFTATNSLTPIFPESWVSPGTHVTSMGKPTEISRGLLLKANRIVAGSREHERNYHDRSAPIPLLELITEGKLSWSEVHELGDLVTGRVSGRNNREEINLFRESQGGFGDVAFAACVYEEAVRRGLGKKVEL